MNVKEKEALSSVKILARTVVKWTAEDGIVNARMQLVGMDGDDNK